MYILKAGEGCVLKMRLVEANGAPIELRNARFVQAILHLPNEATMLCEDVRFDEVSQLVFVRLSAKDELTMEGVYGININALFDGRVVTSAVLDFAEVKANTESRYFDLLIDLLVTTTDVPSCVKYTGASPKISENGTWLVFNDEINAFEDTGISIFGKSAYQAAIESGNFSGTEEAFNAYMGSIPQITNDARLATEAATQATTAANKAGAEAVRIATEAATQATTAANKAGAEAVRIATEAATQATTAANKTENATEQAKEATANANSAAQRANEEVQNLREKADIDGTYPDMTVGKAENLVGRGNSTEEYINFRPSAGEISIEDGSARITAIKGNSVVYNQRLATLFSPTATGNTITSNGITFTKENDGYFHVSGSNTSGQSAISNNSTANYSFSIGHKYLFLVEGCQKSIVQAYLLTSQTSQRFSGNGIITAVADERGMVRILVSNNVEDVDERVRCAIIDLTQMFGAGNEPATVEEFYARKPIGVDEFAYNAGELIDMNVEAIKSVGENAFDSRVGYAKVLGGKTYNFEGTYYTEIEFSTTLNGAREPITLNDVNKYTFESDGYVFVEGSDICINLQHSYNKDITHEYEEDVLALSIVQNAFPNGMCSAGSAYDEMRYNVTTRKWEAIKRVGNRVYEDEDENDTNLTTDGATTNYELAEPNIEELDINFNPNYLIWDFGTEEAIASVPSAPFRANIIYQFNAVDRIRNNSDRIVELESQIASLMQTINTMQTTNVEE